MRVSLPTRLGFLVVALSLIVGSLPVRAADTEAAKRQYAAAAALQNRGVFNLAAEAWVKFIEDHPNDSRLEMAFHYLGVCYLKSNEYDLARQSFETLLETYPKFKLREATYLYLGVAQYSLAQKGQPKQYAAAAKTFETLLQQFPKGEYVPQAIFYLGECEYAQNHKKEAALQYARLVKEHPKSSLAADALYALGVTQEEMGDMDEAGKTYASFLERFPKNSLATEVGMRLGETLFATKKYEEAAKRFAQAAETSGFALADHALFRQAATVAELKQYPEAAALYASVATRFPKSQYANLARLAAGKCFYLAGDFDAAREQLKALLDAGGKLAPEAAHWIARSLLKQRQPAEALATVKKVLPKADKSPLLSQLLMDQAEATYETPKGRGASIAQFADIAKKYPDDPLAPQARYMAAFASLEEGKFKDALNHADAFLAKDAGNKLQPDVMYVAAESHLQLGQLKEAEKLYGQLIEDQGDSPDVLSWTLRRGLVLHMQKKYQEVISVLKPVLGKFKDRDAVAEAQYLLGSSHAELKQYEPARAALEASLAANPKWRQSDDVLLILAHLYRQQGNLEKAQATVRQLIDTFPKSRLLDRAHYRLGEYAYALGDFQKAAAGYQKMLEKWPKSPLAPYALYGLGWAQLSRKEYTEAEKTLSTLIEKHPDDKLVPRARYARGMARQQQKNHGPAIEDLEAILAADPTPEEKSDARYVIGLCQVGLGKHGDAIQTFQALLKEDPRYAGTDKVLYELAWAEKQAKKPDAATKTFTKLVDEHPKSPLVAESYYHLGEANYAKDKFSDAALAFYESMQKAGETDLGEKAAHKLGWAYFRDKEFDNAFQTFDYQRATWPKGPLAADALFMQAECRFEQENYEEAQKLYKQVEKPSSETFEVLTLLHAGQAAGQLKQWKESLELLTRCAEEFPDSPYLPEVLYEQGWDQQNLDQLDEAVKLYKAVVDKTDREVAARAQFMIGEILFQQKKHNDAVKAFYQVIYSYPYPRWQADATYETGRCFEVLGNKKQAKEHYEELIKKFPKSDKVPLAKQRLDALNK